MLPPPLMQALTQSIMETMDAVDWRRQEWVDFQKDTVNSAVMDVMRRALRSQVEDGWLEGTRIQPYRKKRWRLIDDDGNGVELAIVSAQRSSKPCSNSQLRFTTHGVFRTAQKNIGRQIRIPGDDFNRRYRCVVVAPVLRTRLAPRADGAPTVHLDRVLVGEVQKVTSGRVTAWTHGSGFLAMRSSAPIVTVDEIAALGRKSADLLLRYPTTE